VAEQKRQTDSAPMSSRRKLVLAVIVLVITGGIGYIGLRMYRSLETLRDEMAPATTGAQARGLISGIMGAFIAAARPGPDYAECLILPLQPEGRQERKPECYKGSMTISIDKGNADLWRVEIDIDRSV
jgi:hypothetical protein